MAYGDPDLMESKLQLLKESNPYKCNPNDTTRLFVYTAPGDSLLTVTREYFNLDSIAGDAALSYQTDRLICRYDCRKPCQSAAVRATKSESGREAGSQFIV